MRNEAMGRWLFDDWGLRKGYLRVSEDGLEEICEGAPPSDSLKALVIPGFINAHTHIGDAFAYPAPRGRVEEIVAPPDGYKHRVLRSAPPERKLAAMREAATYMANTGTSGFIDFREEGVKGLKEFAESLSGLPVRSVVLGRPSGFGDPRGEASSVLDACDGFGLSAARDFEVGLLREMASLTRASGKAFALHASECVREDIDAILDLKPAFLVHMTAAEDADYARCAEAGVPVVVCPRSNEFFGFRPRISELKRSGVTVALGTDNGMISVPDMIEEMKAAFRLGRLSGALSPTDVVELATSGGRKVLNATGKILTNSAPDSDLVVIRVSGDDPMLELVTEARSERIHAVVRGGKVWRAETCRR
ncbi:MAG: amidohydrolase family protein [Candidatus Thermoplasmatota archaeon]|nr:amidohydrolase family protein [Candidatus Thermoplasmatota archaeon]